MIDPRVSDTLNVASDIATVLRRHPDAKQVLADACRFAGIPVSSLRSAGEAATLVRLADVWPWPHYDGTARSPIEFFRGTMDDEDLLLNRPASEPADMEPADSATLALAEKAERVDDWIQIWTQMIRLKSVRRLPSDKSGKTEMGSAMLPCLSVSSRAMSMYFTYDDLPEFPIIGLNVKDAAAAKQKRRERERFMKTKPLPVTVSVLLTYPLGRPYIFQWEAGAPDMWNLWDLAMAICDHYAQIYTAAGRYGVWGHDLGDLAIEGMQFSPSLRLIEPEIGS